MSRSLRFISYGAGYSLAGIVQLLMTPYLTQRLGVEEYAQLAIVLAAVNWITVFAFLGTHGALKILAVKDRASAGEVLWAGISVACLSGASSSILGLVGVYLGYFDWHTGVLVATTAASQAGLLLILSYFHVIADLKRFVAAAIAAPTITALITVGLIESVNNPNYAYRLLALMLGNLTVVLIGLKQIGFVKVKKNLISRVFSLTWPLAVIQAGQISLFLLDRLLLDLHATAQDVAEYAIYMQLIIPISVGIRAINQVRTVDIYEALKSNGSSAILLGEIKYIALVVFAGACLFAVVSVLPKGLFGDVKLTNSTVYAWMLCNALLGYLAQLSNKRLMFEERVRLSMAVRLPVYLLGCGLMWFFAPMHGVNGILTAISVTYFTHFLSNSVIYLSKMRSEHG
ncbi:hypothetical protein N9K98_07175 [Luminiphilus sp.]|nr:hypothetical protein [Luminiphilus sp.]